MGSTHKRDCDGRAWRVLLALVCVLMIAVSGVVQVAHTHSDGSANHADCSLCAVSHITVHPVQTPAPAPAVTVVATVEAIAPSVVPTALSTFALFTRPPPAV